MLDFSKNYFDLFGLPVGFVVDAAELATRYRELQRVLHPDRFANASDRERRLSLQGATRVNEAYRVLKHPLARAKYLLSLQDIDPDASTRTSIDPEFLMEQMALREELEAVSGQTDPRLAVNELMERLDGKMKQLVGQLAILFETATREHLERAREIVHEMMFLEKLHSQAADLEAELEDVV